jgi:hypothetical protein
MRSVARLVLAAVLLMQAIHVARACVVHADRPAIAFSVQDHCKPQGKQAPLPANACLTQCLQADQTSTASHVPVPAAPDVLALVLPFDCIVQPVPGAYTSAQTIVGNSPPLALRFCSLQL